MRVETQSYSIQRLEDEVSATREAAARAEVCHLPPHGLPVYFWAEPKKLRSRAGPLHHSSLLLRRLAVHLALPNGALLGLRFRISSATCSELEEL